MSEEVVTENPREKISKRSSRVRKRTPCNEKRVGLSPRGDRYSKKGGGILRQK